MMNILEMIDYYMEQGMDEDSASLCAATMYGLDEYDDGFDEHDCSDDPSLWEEE